MIQNHKWHYKCAQKQEMGQARCVSGSDVRRQIQFINKLFEVVAWRRRPVDPAYPFSGRFLNVATRSSVDFHCIWP